MQNLKVKLKKILLIFVLLIFAISPVLTGCDFNLSTGSKLRTPELSISATNKTLSWNKITSAEAYDIYLGNAVVDSIDSTDEKRMVYDFSGLLGESGTYSFYITATTTSIYKDDSDVSNVVEYVYTKKTIIAPTTPDANIDNSSKITFTVVDGVLSFLPLDIDNITYSLYLYSNSTGLNSYPLTSTMVNMLSNNYITRSEIYAIRIGYSYVDGTSTKNVIASDIKYYNNISTKYEGYTDKYYLFDGEIHDFYIENQQELNNLVYYTFINRIESFDIRISDAFKSAIADTYKKSSTVSNVDYAVDASFGSFYETIAYQSNNVNGNFASTNGNAYQYTIKVTYGGVKECDTTISPTINSLYPQSRSTGYYDTVDYPSLLEKYGESYNDFVSDKQFLYTTVTTSEQLYWAIENKITPVFENNTSRAYTIYNKAKSVLREIISDEMSDYEKALSIFDWICINTEYDYTDYSTYTGNISNYPTKLPCFYLEGVFQTGYSVCDGFSKSFSLMCNMLGIDAIRIVGNAKTAGGTGGHAWNKVLLDVDPTDEIPAQYYLVDITWTEIISSDLEEELSHTYFGLSDSDVASTHFAHSGRSAKFNKYVAPSNLNYYNYQKFNYKGNAEDLVISNEQELKDMFDYLLLSGRDTIEIIVDYDYMVSVYNANSTDGTYKSGTQITKEYYSTENLLKSEYDPSTDTFTYYTYTTQLTPYGLKYYPTTTVYNNYKLRTVFQQIVIKSCKFQEQYLFVADENALRSYGNDGVGMLFIFTQNLLIDNENEYIESNGRMTINPDGETSHLVNYFDDNNICDTYYLYVQTPILNNATGDTYVQKITSMFNSFSTDNVKFSFEFVEDTVVSGNNVSSVLFKMTTTSK